MSQKPSIHLDLDLEGPEPGGIGDIMAQLLNRGTFQDRYNLRHPLGIYNVSTSRISGRLTRAAENVPLVRPSLDIRHRRRCVRSAGIPHPSHAPWGCAHDRCRETPDSPFVTGADLGSYSMFARACSPPPTHSVEKAFERRAVMQVLARMNLEAEVDAGFIERVQDRSPAPRQFRKSLLDKAGRTGRPWIDHRPEQGA